LVRVAQTATRPTVGAFARPRVPALVRSEPLLFVGTFAAAIAYAVVAIVRHLHFETAGDLAIFDQAVWHYSRFESPESTVLVLRAGEDWPRLPNILGDHFHPLVVVLAPLYWIWADARMLLVAQAGLVAASVVPVFLFARLHLERLAAYVLAAAYLMYWALHTGVAFNFHEVAFAPLLIAAAIYFDAVERRRAMFASLALLLLVKETLAVFVVFFGLYVVLRRRWREGLIAAAAGIAWYVVATKLLIPLFADGRDFRHWSYPQFGDGFADAVVKVVRDPTLPFVVALDQPVKAETMFFLFAPFLALVVYSPIVLLALPLLAERMLSANQYFWSPHLHYGLTIAPVIAMGAAEGLRNVVGYFRLGDRARVLTVGLAGVILLANVGLAARYPLRRLVEPGFYELTAEQRAAADAVALLPRHDESVATEEDFLPHLSERSDIYLLRPGTPLTDWIVYRVGGSDETSAPDLAVERRLLAERRSQYRTVFAREDVRVLRRR
jgi:uncharacterized membrane protein